jgi:hypothetical protein
MTATMMLDHGTVQVTLPRGYMNTFKTGEMGYVQMDDAVAQLFAEALSPCEDIIGVTVKDSTTLSVEAKLGSSLFYTEDYWKPFAEAAEKIFGSIDTYYETNHCTMVIEADGTSWMRRSGSTFFDGPDDLGGWTP